ncbi:hypothetical protein D3C72_1795450 [compost metagenome]
MSGGFRRRDDTVHGGIDKANVLFDPGFIFVGDGGQNVAFQLRGTAHHVFTGDDIQRRGDALGFTF